MKYKVGDKVRIREDLVMGENYGGSVVVDDMTDMGGSVVTIERVGYFGYYIEEDPDEYCWTDEMFEPVEEMSAEEAIKVLADMCARECKNCELGKLVKESKYSFCSDYRREHPDKVVEILKQWKKDNEKKEVETEFVNIISKCLMDLNAVSCGGIAYQTTKRKLSRKYQTLTLKFLNSAQALR